MNQIKFYTFLGAIISSFLAQDLIAADLNQTKEKFSAKVVKTYSYNYLEYLPKDYDGKTKFPLFSKNPIREFIRGLTAYSAAPLYISFLMGMITSLFSIGLIFYALITKILGISTPGTPSVLIAVALFSGVLLMTNGVLGIYIARIYHEIKGRPRYIIESVSKPKGKSKV